MATAALAVGVPAAAHAATKISFTSLQVSSHVVVMNGDGSERTTLTSSTAGDVSPAWSPAGTRLAFIRRRADGRDDVFIVNGDGTRLRRLTRTATREANPVWAPRGGWIAYERGRAFASLEIFVQTRTGAGAGASPGTRCPTSSRRGVPAAGGSPSPATSRAEAPRSTWSAQAAPGSVA